MNKKFYVVWKGAKTGVFSAWSEVKSYTQGRADAQFMGFPSQDEAEKAFASTYTKALMNRSLNKNEKTISPRKASNPATVKTTSNFSADIHIYCDGACSPNPGKSGTGVAIYQQGTIHSLYYGLHQANGTNNTAELNGLLEALKLAQGFLNQDKADQQAIEILSDSRYSIDCVIKWARGWKAKGWTRGKGEDIKNLAIIQQCFSLYEQLKKFIKINHVKGHANIEGNELSDRMAVLARMKEQLSFVRFDGELDIKAILAMPSG